MKITKKQLKQLIQEQVRKLIKEEETKTISVDDFWKNVFKTWKNKNAMINIMINHVPIVSQAHGKFDQNLELNLKMGKIIIPTPLTAKNVEFKNDVYIISYPGNLKFTIFLKN